MIVVCNPEAKLASLLGHVDLVHTRWQAYLEALEEPTEDKVQQRKGNDNSGAASSTCSEGQECEVGTVGLYDFVCIQKPFGTEFEGAIPQLGTVGDPPSVHQNLALRRNVVASKLGGMEIHVRHQERDCHSPPHCFLHNSCKERQLPTFEVRLLYGLASQHQIQLFLKLCLDARIVH